MTNCAATFLNATWYEELDNLIGRAFAALGLGAGPSRITSLFGDGSDRSFFRVRSSAGSFVVLVSPRVKPDGTDENDSYLRIGRHLFAKEVPVPQILWADPANGQFLLEDVGDLHLQRFAATSPNGLEATYRQVLRLLAHMHRSAVDGFDPSFCFDTPLYDPSFVYARELEYFRKAFVNGYLGLDAGPEEFLPDFEDLAALAGETSRRFVFHRDFQSRNLMVHSQRLRLLDFQGMRFGPPAYDLASLLLDPYVALPIPLQERLFSFFRPAAQKTLGCGCAEFRRKYEVVRLCRNMQILGAFGYLGGVKGKTQFFGCIPWAWKELLRWMEGPCGGRFPKLRSKLLEIERLGRRRTEDGERRTENGRRKTEDRRSGDDRRD